MDSNTIVGAGRVRFLKPGEKYHLVRETQWERDWEAEGLLPKRWVVASRPVVITTFNGDKTWLFIDTDGVERLNAIRGSISSNPTHPMG